MRNFQQIILDLQQFWANHNCVIMQPYDTEVGAGTLHPSTSLKALGPDTWNVAYVQPSRRPKDGRYGENPNRFGHYYQFQVILKPSPEDIQQLCLESLYHIGIEPGKHDIRFVEDDWENPTIGAWGLGWEVWCDGMEVLQFTYMQQIGGIECSPIPGELTYGLERLATYIQNVDRLVDIVWWNSKDNKEKITYGDIYLQAEKEFCAYSLEVADISILLRQFEDNSTECKNLLEKKLPLPAYHHCLKTSHIFNLLDARGAISVTERAAYIAKVRNLARECASSWVESQNA